MTTNEIEKQLKLKSRQEIKECAGVIVQEIQRFNKKHTDTNYSGMQWYHRHCKPTKRYDHSPEPDDPWNHFDWKELTQLIVRNMEENWLNKMVEKKSKELLSKIDLFE